MLKEFQEGNKNDNIVIFILVQYHWKFSSRPDGDAAAVAVVDGGGGDDGE